MKKSIIYLSLSIIILAGAACNKQLNQQPISTLPASAFWKTPQDALTGNAAIYAGMQNAFSTAFIEWGDARSDNFTYGGTGENQVNISLNGLDAITASADWGNIYNTIARANLAIKYLPTVSGLTAVQTNNYLAQAYASRAFMYFWAVRLWGAVPVRLTPYESIDSSQYLARTPADTVLNNVIIPDLLMANSLVDKSALSTFTINTGAILSILAEVYLWKHDYTNVLATTNQLITLKRYALMPASNYKDVFITAVTAENIWTLNWDYILDGPNAIGVKLGSNSNTSNYTIDNTVLKIWESNKGDIRRNLEYDTTIANAGVAITNIWKYYPLDVNTGKPNTPSKAQNEAKLPFYRWPDILLMRAEALNWGNNDKAGAFNLLNLVRNRANAGGLDSTKYNSQLDVESAILGERQLELFAEGKRWFDLVRTNRVIATMDQLIKTRQGALGLSQYGFSDPRKILWPVSRQALIADPLLVQNPPYSR